MLIKGIGSIYSALSKTFFRQTKLLVTQRSLTCFYLLSDLIASHGLRTNHLSGRKSEEPVTSRTSLSIGIYESAFAYTIMALKKFHD